MVEIFYEEDASLEPLKGKVITIIGYGDQGTAQAKNMRDSGLEIVLGLREEGPSWKRAKEDGFEVHPIPEAVKKGNVTIVLIPDEVQAKVYQKSIEPHLSDVDALGFSSGFNIVYDLIKPPETVDVIMVAPKGNRLMTRRSYVKGSGVPALIAIRQDYSGSAMDKALAWGKAIGSTRAGIIKTSFEFEIETDLFGESAVLCGGLTELIKKGFETLIEEGYPKKVAYFETLNEAKMIMDQIYEEGIEGMWNSVSNSAEYGGRIKGKEVIDEHVKKNMEKLLKDIQKGKHAKEWIQEKESGLPSLSQLRNSEKNHPIEKVGKEIRKMMKNKNAEDPKQI